MSESRPMWGVKIPTISTRDRIDDIPGVKVVKSHNTKFTVYLRDQLIGHVRRDVSSTGLFGFEMTKGDRNLSMYSSFTDETKRGAVVRLVRFVDSIGGDIDGELNRKALRDGEIMEMWRRQNEEI